MGKYIPLSASDLAGIEEQLFGIADQLKVLNDRMMGSFVTRGGVEDHPGLLDAAKEVANEASTFYQQTVGRYLHGIQLREIERKFAQAARATKEQGS